MSSRRIIIEVVAVVFLIVANFLTTDYLPHLVTRQIYMIICVCSYVYANSKDVEVNMFAAVTNTLLLNLGVETIIYVNHKSKA